MNPKLEKLGEKFRDALQEAYEIGFHAASPNLCLSPPMMGRDEEGEDEPRDMDYEIWNLQTLIDKRIRFTKTVNGYPNDEDIKDADNWVEFFENSAKQFKELRSFLERKVKRRKD